MFNFECCLDTGYSKPVCCRHPVYGIHERKIMNTYIQIMEENNWICDYDGPWGSLLVLATKPHQEGWTDINEFIWCLCVSYRPWNGVTKSFEYPIPRWSDRIEDFGDFSDRISFISLNDRSGYHQIRVRKTGQKKLAFFTPNDKNKTLKVMPFGTKNAPAFYTVMMNFLRDDWILSFNETKHNVSFDHSSTKIICDDRIIIDDILLFSNHIPTLLHYFPVLHKECTKYRLSF